MSETDPNTLLERAIAIAVAAHAGQCDKGGNPYLLHPLRVMLSVAGEYERVVAVLHDVLEDSLFELHDLQRFGFPMEVLEAVDALTKQPGEDYRQFIVRVKASGELARTVKCADLRDNLELSRLGRRPDEEALKRAERYRQALATLQRD